MTKKSLLEIVSERQYLSFNPLKKLLSFIKFSLLLSYKFLSFFFFFYFRSFKNICRWFSLLKVKHLTSRLFSFFSFPSFYSKSRLCFDFDNCERQLYRKNISCINKLFSSWELIQSEWNWCLTFATVAAISVEFTLLLSWKKWEKWAFLITKKFCIFFSPILLWFELLFTFFRNKPTD